MGTKTRKPTTACKREAVLWARATKAAPENRRTRLARYLAEATPAQMETRREAIAALGLQMPSRAGAA